MKEFKMYADIVYHDSFQEFMEGENVGAKDFILTNEFLYNQYVKPLNPNCGSLFIEAYGKGEPTTEMKREPQLGLSGLTYWLYRNSFVKIKSSAPTFSPSINS